MSFDRDRKPPYLDRRIDFGKALLVGVLFLILLVIAMWWPAIS